MRISNPSTVSLRWGRPLEGTPPIVAEGAPRSARAGVDLERRGRVFDVRRPVARGLRAGYGEDGGVVRLRVAIADDERPAAGRTGGFHLAVEPRRFRVVRGRSP